MSLFELPDSAIRLRAHAATWQDAITRAGEVLVEIGATTPAYTDRMISVVDEFGAYIVIAPGLALSHARPGADVTGNGLSVVTLAEPVPFGNPHNDPVSVVLGLALTSAENHVTTVAQLANIFNDPAAIPAIIAATSPEEVRAVFASASANHR